MIDMAGKLSRSGRIRDNLKSLLRIFDVPLAAAVGFLLYYVMAYVFIDRLQIIPISRSRLIEIKRFLNSQTIGEGEKKVLIFGSSTVIEGIDCNIIDGFLAKDLKSYNLAWTGGSSHELLLLLPSIKASHPTLVVLCVDYWSLFGERRIPVELLNIARWWDFFPENNFEYFEPMFNEQELHDLQTPRFIHLWQMRSFLPETFETYVREFSRSDLRYKGYQSNFKSPWVRTKIILPAAMNKDLESLRKLMAGLKAEDINKGLRSLDATINYLCDNNVKVMIVLPPLNPNILVPADKDIKAHLLLALSELSQKHSITFVDHSMLLQTEHFADGAHTFETGRAAWSKALGQIISKEFVRQ
jgi:hypothetical protein